MTIRMMLPLTVFVGGGDLRGQGWNGVMAKARQVVDPTLDVAFRLTKMREVIDQLYDMESQPTIIYVDKRATGQEDGTCWRDAFATIQEGIDGSTEGDWVWVAEGEYEESIVFREGILLFGGFRGNEDDLGDRDVAGHRTTIRGNGINHAVYMEHKTLIDGFLITNGGGGSADGGGGIFTGDWLAIIRNNVIQQNHVIWTGGGILVRGGNNSDEKDGYSPIIEGNLIANNSTEAKCGDGICTRSSAAMMAWNTIVNHPSRGIEVVINTGNEPTIVNSILWNHEDDLYNHETSTGEPIYLYNCSKDWEEDVEGLINSEPAFADSANGDFTLLPQSDCIDKGLPEGPRDPDDTRADLGAYPYYQHDVSQGVEIRLDATPEENMTIMMDGKVYGALAILSLHPNSTHTLRAIEHQRQTQDARYSFYEWQDGGNRVRNITAAGPAQYTAEYRLQYFVEIDTDGKDVDTEGEGWHFQGERVVISVDNEVMDALGTTRHVFESWTGTGWGSYSGNLRQAVIRVNEPIVQTVNWLMQYKLDVLSDYGDVQGGGWYAPGTDTTVYVDSTIDIGYGERVVFQAWEGSGAGSYTGPDNPARVRMDGPVTERAVWQTQYRLSVSVFPSGVEDVTVQLTPEGPWYNPGTEVRIEAVSTDTQYTFLRWDGDVISATNPLSLTIDNPMSVAAHFQVTNRSPRILSLPDTTVMEDSVLTLPFSWFQPYVFDPDDPIETLVWDFSCGDYIEVVMDSTHEEISIIPETNWNGNAEVVARVTDPEGLFAADTFTVTVLPVNDSPGHFALLVPVDGILLPMGSQSLTFIWEESRNVDPGDDITYRFYASPQPSLSGPNTIEVASIQDTTLLDEINIAGIVYWGVVAEDGNGLETWCDDVFRIDVESSVEEDGIGIPSAYSLSQNTPNPFNAETTILYQTPKHDRVRLRVFDIHGSPVRTLFEGRVQAGDHSVVWNGRDDGGEIVPSGVYIYRIEFGDRFYTRKLVLTK